jgi:hypothetical protein
MSAEEINKEIAALKSELEIIESAQVQRENQHLVGKYIKSTNPNWTFYTFITRVRGRSVYGRGFNEPTRDKLAIYFEFDAEAGKSKLQGYQEISKEEFLAAWASAVGRINEVIFE